MHEQYILPAEPGREVAPGAGAPDRMVLMLYRGDGSCCKGPVVPVGFDTEAWAASRQRALSIMEVIRVEAHVLD